MRVEYTVIVSTWSNFFHPTIQIWMHLFNKMCHKWRISYLEDFILVRLKGMQLQLQVSQVPKSNSLWAEDILHIVYIYILLCYRVLTSIMTIYYTAYQPRMLYKLYALNLCLICTAMYTALHLDRWLLVKDNILKLCTESVKNWRHGLKNREK